jgi:hypothetical protein
MLFCLVLITSCGKVDHKVSGTVRAETSHDVWINYKKAFDDWVAICYNLYPHDQFENFKCRKEAADKIATMLTLNIEDINEVQDQAEGLLNGQN